jgi:fatty acid desaturase
MREVGENLALAERTMETGAGRQRCQRNWWTMNNTLLIVIAVVALILLLVGGFNSALNFLLWVGIILLVIAIILFIVRSIGGRRGV